MSCFHLLTSAGAIDVDRLVQERDLVILQENLINVINYNLDHEYDVKILDPNFVKLFKLAQLSVDYLMYSQQHVFNCVELAEDQINKLSKIFHQQEIERTKKECKKKDLVLKHLKRKLKELEKIKAKEPPVLPHQYLQAGHGISSQFKCGFCGKAFLTDIYLEAHLVRRHNTLVQQNVSREPERPHTDFIFQEKVIEKDNRKEFETELQKKMQSWQDSQQQKLRDEMIALQKNGFDVTESIVSQVLRPITTALRSWFLSAPSAFIRRGFDVMKLKDSIEKSTPNSELLESIQKQETNLISFQDHFGEKVLEDVGNQLQSLDNVWKSRLASLESEHRNELETLTARLSCNEAESEKAKLSYEAKILALISRVREQVVIMKAQGERIQMLNEKKARVDEPKTVGDGDAGTPLSSGIHVDYIINTNLSEEQQEKKRESAPLSNSRDNLIDKVVVDSSERQGSAHSSRDSGLDSPKRTLLVPTLAEEKNVSESTNDSDSGSGSDEETSASPTNSEASQSISWSIFLIQSLEDTIALNPRILAELKNNLQDILIRKLREIGIDPSWTGIPLATFKQKMVTLKHHQTLVAKLNLRRGGESDATIIAVFSTKTRVTKIVSLAAVSPMRSDYNTGITITAISSLYTKYVSKVYVVNTRSLVAVTDSTGAGPQRLCTRCLDRRGAPAPPLHLILYIPTVARTTIDESVEEIDKEPHSSSSNDNEESDLSEVEVKVAKQPTSYKGVLKTPQYAAGSLSNKRATFNNTETKYVDTTLVTKPPSTTFIPMTENMPVSQSQFSIESPRNTSSKTVTFSEDVKKQKPNTDMDSDSDWSISSDESAAKIKISTEDQTTALLDVGGGPTIHLSTKQSAKIAEISKSIEHQTRLHLCRSGDTDASHIVVTSSLFANIFASLMCLPPLVFHFIELSILWFLMVRCRGWESCLPLGDLQIIFGGEVGNGQSRLNLRRKYLFPRAMKPSLLSRITQPEEEGFVVKHNATILIVKDKQPEEGRFVVEHNATILIVKDNASRGGNLIHLLWVCIGLRNLLSWLSYRSMLLSSLGEAGRCGLVGHSCEVYRLELIKGVGRGVTNVKWLSLTRRKPVGGVEAMFSEERTENNINIANRPIPKPRQQLQLSDWDLEDLEDFPSS
uniref:(California timema) hypothetical protein n=1 Tax=Timema californicum TaxID=61474 RepID=A0A7R9P4B0_TIMCA|nr:unnamed protein product [Timema californicum]